MESYEKLRQSAEPPRWDDFGVPEEARKTFARSMLEYTLADAHGFWLEPSSRDGHCRPNEFVVDVAGRLSALSDFYNGNSTQSPIEDMLAGALMWLNLDFPGFPSPDFLNGPKDHLAQFGPSSELLYYITAQAPIAGYKVDFLLWLQLKSHVVGVVIECDGHDFHEKTKEQAAADKKRDRDILSSGFPVMRFTGSEIFKDALSCVAQVREVLTPIMLRISKDGG